jgi:hypothetical protein
MNNRLFAQRQSQAIHPAVAAGLHHAAVTPAETPALAHASEPSGFGRDFTRISARTVPGLQRDVSARTTDASASDSADLTQALTRAASDHSGPLDQTVRQPLEERLGHDLSRVRVFQGPASAQAAERLGARAYTLGSSIYLGSEAVSLGPSDRTQLLTHEAVHTVQQGGVTAAPQAGLAVSSPHDAAEVEARQIAYSIEASTPPSHAPATPVAPAVARLVAPHLQRDLTGKKSVKDGDFDLDLKTESHPGAKNGMSGTIKFTASDKAPDSDHIRLLQVIRNEDLTTKKEYEWTGDEANRNKVMTKESPGIKPGYHVDQSYGKIKPRTDKADAPVSPYYIDYENSGVDKNYDGVKKGVFVTAASLWDYPGSSGERRFNFETAAKDADKGYIYATLTWGFTISDAAKGKVENEHATAHRGPSDTFMTAVDKFNEFFKNPGSSQAPK